MLLAVMTMFLVVVCLTRTEGDLPSMGPRIPSAVDLPVMESLSSFEGRLGNGHKKVRM